MKKFSFFLFFMGLFMFVSSQTSEQAPFIAGTKSVTSTNVWTVQFSSDISSAIWGPGTYGIESDGTHLYVTKWASNKFYKITTTGALVDSFAVSGSLTGGIRDLAFDGTYFYGGSNSNVIYKMDFVTKAIVSTITLPSGFAVRHIAYDPTANGGAGGLWVGPWNTLGPRLYSMTGTLLDSIPAANLGSFSASGSAFDNVTPGGPYLWLYSQASGSNMNDVIQVKISTKQKTGLMSDMTQVLSGITSSNISGGLFQTTNLITGTTTLGGLVQGKMIWGVDLASTNPQPNGVKIKTLNVGSIVQINTPQTIAGSLEVTGSNAVTSYTLNYSIDNAAPISQNVTGVNIPGLSTANYSHSTQWTPTTNGSYNIKVWASNINGNSNYISDTLSKNINVVTNLVFRKVVLEEYTGIHCTYCPDGHKIANQYKALHPNDVFLINIHQGSYATPSAGEPDFRTQFGDALANQTGLTGYPSGTINRHVFPPNTSTALSRSVWAAKGDEVLAMPTYANMSVTSATVDAQTRQLSVTVQVNYFANGPAINMMNVALLQNNIEGPQTGGNTNPAQMLPNGKYNHLHALRHLLTGQWGDTIPNTSNGTVFTKTYTYTLPNTIGNIDVELGNLEIVAFVAEGKQEIITGAESSVNITNIPYNRDIAIDNIDAENEICAAKVKPVLRVKNLGSETVTSITFNHNINGATSGTFTWTGSIAPYASKSIDYDSIVGFTVQANNTLTIEVAQVNGASDQNSANNSKTKTFTMTNNNTNGIPHVFTFVQDRYGSESTWKIVEDATGAIVASGGPYTDLTANGTATHTHNVTFSATGCYSVYVYDSYGDGINAGYGAGNYNLKNAANQVVISSTGQFTTMEKKIFNLTSLIGVEEINSISNVAISPNPAKDNVNIQFFLNSSKNVTISLYNSLGALVYSENKGELNGSQNFNLNLGHFSKGIYYLNIQTGDNIISNKLIVE
jgi:hypothetical protein